MGRGRLIVRFRLSIRQATKKMLYESLTKEEQTKIEETASLLDLTEEYVRIKYSQQPLFSEIQRIFRSVTPTPGSVHETIAKIPQIHTIITTNYDKCFEHAYGGNMEIVTKPVHTQYLNPGKPHLYKIHGDIDDPESMVITSSQYREFFKANENPIWSLVRSKMISNNILFIGYLLKMRT
ncbi:SIR2 family protein [Chitinophaga sedimenti]|uniref:SIR2 family NAD-dependent protein deacylase n=1 Tax=Chitinophaga sedimenti TaxID=2033606 RepID=UPI00200588F8|nr:SIR2 family protein [Chitinophaga sedimenti]MCK7556538.1 SIR2 family protein [Chitinophaga sedimenti]